MNKLVKHGRIQNRDLVCEVCSKDFKNMCKTMQEKCFAARREAFELRENLKLKNNNYIYRENEYRKTVAMLKQEILKHSKDTLRLPKDTADDELELEGGLLLDLNRDSKDAAAEGKSAQEDGVHRDLKANKDIDSANKEIMAKITRMQANARRKLADDRTKLWSQLDENLEQLKQDLEKANEKRQGNENQQDKEISNHKTL